MKKVITGVSLAMAAAMLNVAPAWADSPHFVGPVTVVDQGTTLEVTGSVAGLGNEDVRIVLTATGVAVVDCQNPGGNVAPGQNKTVSVQGEQVITDVKNGRVNFDVTTVEPVVGSDACPNPQWTPIVRDVVFTDADIAVFQPVTATTPTLTRDVL